MDFKKILQQLDKIDNKKTKLNEATMNISFNADTADEVGTMLDRLKGVATPALAPTSSNMNADMQKFRSALGGMEGPPEPPMMDTEKEGTVGGIAGATIGGAMGGMPGAMAGGAIGDKLTGSEEKEEWSNEPDEDYKDTEYMTKDLAGGLNREKKMFKPAAKGDNPMAVADEATFESIRDRLYKALTEKKAKPDFLDMDKDGNKKEPMKKAVADKKKKVKEAAKPDFLDMDKDGNKKEPMKKAVADQKKK